MNCKDEFVGKRVLVTGAAGVFGSWIADTFALHGSRLLLADRRSDALEDLKTRLALKSREVITHATDLRDPGSIRELVEVVTRFWAAPDIVVNNAGIYPSQYLLDMDLNNWQEVMDVNLTAPFLLTRDLARLMIKDHIPGAVVNITSAAANTTRLGSGHYSTSKAGLTMLTRAYALELAPHGIRVNAVSPGFAPGSEVSNLNANYIAAVEASIPLGRTSGPHDAAKAVLFLCSDSASYITGTTLTVDGGRSAGTFKDRT